MMTKVYEQPLLRKYPSTPHLQGSRLQLGDDASTQVPYSRLAGRYIVVEEKIDGGQAGLSYSPSAETLLQSKGHYLEGGGRERQFALLKRWAAAHESRLLPKLEDVFVMFGEWCHKKHAIYYDALPHYFNEFDIWDRSREVFLSTDERARVLGDAPVLPVPVLYKGPAPRTIEDLLARLHLRRHDCSYQELKRRYPVPEMLLPHSLAKTDRWKEVFERIVQREGYDLARCWQQTDKNRQLEGLYIKVEENGVVAERYKWIRSDFVQAVNDSKLHHSQQPFVPNQLHPAVDLFSEQLAVTWRDLGLVTVEEA